MRADATVFGWDVGGAHVKVSKVSASGALLDVAQWACPLWQGLEHLEKAIDLVFGRWPDASSESARHAITMTGEMVDLFNNRAEGVRVLAQLLSQRLGANARFFAGRAGWLGARDCAECWREVASANWLASATWVASRVRDAVFIDIGSTTTDIVPVVEGRVVAIGRDDATRLVSGELLYQGVVRTPLCGLAHRIRFRGEETNVMNEWFATTADVYRLTGELWPAHDQHASADNGPKTGEASRARLARTIGRDAHDASDDEWRHFAQSWRDAQIQALAANLARVVAMHPALAAAPLVGAGCGRFLAAALVKSETRGFIEFASLIGNEPADKDTREWIATCAPSVAVGLLAASAERDASKAGEMPCGW
jgi:probable H4MPT-linked C1 transfer pathway protein